MANPDIYRKAELAKIHIARQQMGICDGDYRAMLLEITGRDSAKDLTTKQRRSVLEHLKTIGFTNNKTKGKPKNAQGPSSRAKQLQKIEALLTLGGKSWAYADALALRICKVETMAWVPEHDLYKIITALRMQARREGWDLVE